MLRRIAGAIVFVSFLLVPQGCSTPSGDSNDGAGTQGPQGDPGPEGPAGPPGPIDSTAPGAPTNLRVFPIGGTAAVDGAPSGPPAFQLRWDPPAGLLALSSFVVYESQNSFDAPQDELVMNVVPGSAHAATILLYPAGGLRHLRVSAISYTGVEGALSNEYVVDTTSRIVFTGDKRSDEVVELFSVVPGSGVEPTRISGDIVSGGRVAGAIASPDGRRVAFLSDRLTQGIDELFVTPIDGSSPPIRVSGNLVAGGQAAFGSYTGNWSPDGSRIAFIADRLTDEVNELFVVAADGGSDPVRVSGAMIAGGNVSVAQWSPDGRRIAFLADRITDGVNELFVSPADGSSDPVRVSGTTLSGGDVLNFNWSPDGMFLDIGGRIGAGPPTQELFVTRADGSIEPVRVSGTLVSGGAVNGIAQWSPDGSRLAFYGDKRTDNVQELFVARPDGAAEPVVVSGVPTAFMGITEFAWSPDGTRLAFLSDKLVNLQTEVFVTSAAGGEEPVLISGAVVAGTDFSNPAWSPDGSRVAFVGDKLVDGKFEVFVADVDAAGEPVLVSGTAGNDRDSVVFRWSPDGSRILFHSDRDTNDTFELFVAPAAGGVEPIKVSGTLTTGGNINFTQMQWSPLSN